MAQVTVEGIYKDGKVELLERPKGLTEGQVTVTLMSSISSVTEEMENANRLKAAERMIKRMREGIDLGGKFDRNALYDERIEELERRRGRY